MCSSKCSASTLRWALHCGPFFFAENTIAGVIYRDRLEAFCFPQPDEIGKPDIVYQQTSLRLLSAVLCGTL